MNIKIAIVLVATGPKYRQFLTNLVPQIHQYFTRHPKDLFLISDIDGYPDVHRVLTVEHLPMPLPSLLRYHWICRLRDQLSGYSHIYYIDVDSQIVSPIGDEVLAPLIAVRHWAWPLPELTRLATFETRPESQAQVDAGSAAGYFQASLQGGETRKFLAVAETLRDRINADLNRGYGLGGLIAVWWDESHWNWYVNSHLDQVRILPPEYAQRSQR